MDKGRARTVVVAVVGRDLLAHGDGLDNAERDHLAVPQQLAVVVAVVLHSEIKSKYEECIGNITF